MNLSEAKKLSKQGYKQYDLHTHTHYSSCSTMKPEDLVKTALDIGLDGIAVTDHNSIKGAVECKAYAQKHVKRKFEVIIGEEVTTEYGHVLVLYLKKKIAPGSLESVIAEAKQQNALVIPAHPFTLLKVKGKSHTLQSIAKIKKVISGLECYNGRIFFPFLNQKSNRICDKLNLAKTAGSDGHFAFEIGRGRTLFKGELRKAIHDRSTKIYGAIPISTGSVLSLVKWFRKKKK